MGYSHIGVNENIASKIIPGSIIRCKAIWSFLRFMPDRSFLLFDSLVHFLSNLFTACLVPLCHEFVKVVHGLLACYYL